MKRKNAMTDMGHCEWCSWDLYLADAVDGMHPKCKWRATRRASLRETLIPALIEMGITAPDRHNLLTDVCLRIEKGFDEYGPELIGEKRSKQS